MTGVCAPDGNDENLKKYLSCLSDGQDVRPCCVSRGVPSPCDQFCNPKAGMPRLNGLGEQLKCLNSFADARNCYWGYMNNEKQ